MPTPLRCDNKKHADRISDHVIEVKCNSRFCGAERGVVVLHRFDLASGEMTTRKFTDPQKGSQ